MPTGWRYLIKATVPVSDCCPGGAQACRDGFESASSDFVSLSPHVVFLGLEQTTEEECCTITFRVYAYGLKEAVGIIHGMLHRSHDARADGLNVLAFHIEREWPREVAPAWQPEATATAK